MSKLPVVSGAECVKALSKVGFVFIVNVAATSQWFEKNQRLKQQSLITKN